MILKISKGVWLVSILGVLAALLTVYASLPEEVVLFLRGNANTSISREAFFYVILITVTVVNSFVFLVSALNQKDEALRSWFNGLITTVNLFFVVALFFLNSLNGTERFDFSSIGFLVYSSVILISVWALSWPIILLLRKFSAKGSAQLDRP